MKTKHLLSLIALAMLCTTNAWGATSYTLTGTSPNKTLTITGSGDMTDFSESENAPWYGERSNIKTIIISDGITHVGAYAFRGITYSSITIPVSVESFGNRAFWGISSGSAKNVYYKGTPNEWAQIDFAMPASYASSHPFYQGSDDASYATSNHIYFYNQKTTETTKIVFTPGLEEIKPYVFWHAGNITNVNIPHSVTSIGKKAFWKCSNLCRIYINNTSAPTTGTDVFSGIRYNATLDNSSWLYLPAGASASTSAPGYRRAPWYDSENTGKGASCIGYYGTDKSKSSTGNNFSSYITNSKVYPTSGTVDGIDWELDEDGVMTFSGSGAITTEFATGTGSNVVYPWLRFSELTDKVVIKGGVTGLSNALANFTALREIIIEQTTIPTASATLPTYIHCQKVNVYIDNSSTGDANLSSAPWNNSKLQKTYTTTFCNDPTGLTISPIGTTSATASWTDESGDTWKYLCLPASYGAPYSEDWNDATPIYSSKTANVTGLTSGTKYVFYLKADCGTMESEVIYEEFTTDCGIIAHAELPWSENFDACTSGVNAPCWAQKNSGDASVAITTYQYYSSPKSLRLTGGTSAKTAIAILPEFADDIKTLMLSFRYRADKSTEYDNYGTPELGYITNINNAATFVKVQDLEQTNWKQIINFFVPANTPDGARFAIRYTNSTNGNTGYTDIDNVTVNAIPECSQPTNVEVSGITNEGATITWNANGMSAWVLQVSEGDNEHWGEDISADDNSKTLTGLEDNTVYYVRVKADCGVFGESGWSSVVSFRTECDAIDIDASTPWSENFNAMSEYIVPECWNNSASTATPYWGESYFIWGTYDVSGNKMLCMSNASVDGGIALINTPAFAIPDDGKEYEFMFDYANHASSDLIVKMSVDGSAFGVVNTYHNTGSNSVNPGELTSETISLYGHNGSTVKLQFYTTPASGYYSTDGAMFVDNVGVRKVPTCFQPTALAASSITANSAHLTWTAGASESSWKLQYRASGGEWSEDITVNTTAAKDLESLSAHTTYEVRVKAWCNTDDYSEYSEIAEFTTLCAAESLPFSETFGLTTSLPACWEATPASGDYKWSGNYNGDNGYAQLRTGYSGTATLCMPPMDLSADAILRFKWKNANGITVNLYISIDGGETKTLITDELSATQADWTTKQYNLSAYTGEEAQFYFIATFSTQNQYAYLDDVEVFAIPTEVFLDNASATDNEDRLEDLMGQIANITINRPLLRNGDYCTLTLPFNLSAEQIAEEDCPLHGFTIKEFERSESGTEVNIYLTEVSEIVAGKPYFVRYAGTPTNERLTPLNFRGVTVTAYEPVDATLSDDCTPYGVFNPHLLVANDQSTLFLSSNNTLYYPSANGTMNGFRAYIKVGSGSSLGAPIRNGAIIRIVEKENTATGIGEVRSETTDVVRSEKILRDGQMIIIREGKEYNVMGNQIR